MSDRGGCGSATDPIRDEEPRRLSNEELRGEYDDLTGELENWQDISVKEHNAIVERLDAIWKELLGRVPAEMPDCPGCGHAGWEQRPGEPVTCADCGRTPTDEAREEIWSVHDEVVGRGGCDDG